MSPESFPVLDDHLFEVRQELAERLHTFKTLVIQADQQAIRNHGEISESLQHQVGIAFKAIGRMMHREMADDSPLALETRNELGALVRSEMLPFLLLTRSGERSYSRPRGYAGDFLTIAEYYENQPTGTGRVGALLDRCFLDSPGVLAVQNRRQLLVEEILRTVNSKPADEPVYVTSLACGPAAEIFDVFAQLDDPSRLHVTLIDMDEQALAYVAEQAQARQLDSQILLVQGNLIHFSVGRRTLQLPAQDLVYSIGLIDYLQDSLVVKLANWIHKLLSPGGRVVLGNFHPRNPSKQFMDHILDWKLIHRSEPDMDELYLRSAFERPCTRIRFEAQEINLFAECTK
jgi:SAM-dependent methyltransferase